MATAKKKRTVPPTEELPVYVEDPMEETVAGIIEQFGPGDIHVKVYRLDRGKSVFCQTMYNPNPADVNEETIRAMNWGAGDYVLKIYVGGLYKHQIQMSIAAQPNEPGRENESPMMRMLMDQIARLEQRLTMAPPRDREPINDIADAMLKIHTIQSAQPQNGMTPETILQWIQLGKELGSGSSGDDSIMGLLKEVAPGAIQALIASRGGIPAGAQPNPPQLPVVPEEQPNVKASELLLKHGIEYLKKKCKSGSDPGLYIDLIVDNAGEPGAYAELVHAVTTKEFSAFIQIDPTIGEEPFREFFETIYNGLRQEFKPVDPVVVPTRGANGHAANVTSHGANGKGRSK